MQKFQDKIAHSRVLICSAKPTMYPDFGASAHAVVGDVFLPKSKVGEQILQAIGAAERNNRLPFKRIATNQKLHSIGRTFEMQPRQAP